jgi:hypothetical protein
MAVTSIVIVAQSGVEPLEMAVSIAAIVCTYIVAETARPSGAQNGSD